MKTIIDKTEYAFDFLCKRNVLSDTLEQMDWVVRLMDFQDKKGDDAICALAGFYLYIVLSGKNEEEQTRALVSTFSHDLGGANDSLLLPRSSEYIAYLDEELNKCQN